MSKPICIAFATAAGVGKTPVAHYLSINLNLPIFSNDSIRTEVREDKSELDEDVYNQRRDERLKHLLKTGHSFIYEASVDRKWPSLKKELEENGYRFFIISFDLSTKFIEHLYDTKGYGNREFLPGWINDHRNFLEDYRADVGLMIDNSTYPERLKKSLAGAKQQL